MGDSEKGKRQLVQEVRTLRSKLARIECIEPRPKPDKEQQAENLIHRQDSMARILLENLPCIAMILKKGTREIVYSNDAARKVGAVPGKICYETCAQRDDPCPFCLAPQVWAENTPRYLDVEYRGEYYEGRWLPLNDDLYVHYIFITSERKKAQEALRESEMMNRSLLEGSSVCNKIIDMDFKLRYMSAAGLKQLKIPDIEPYYGKTYPPEFYPESMRAPLIKNLKIAMAGKIATVEAPVHDMEGNEVWYHTTFVPALDDNGQVKYVIGSSVDITERKRTQKKLQDSEDKYRKIVSTTTDAIMLFDAETKQFLDVNTACQELYGYSREEFLALKHETITAEPDKSRDSIKKTVEGELKNIPLRYHKKKDGTIFPVEISCSALKVGGRKALCGVIRDITERKKAEETIKSERQRFFALLEQLPAYVYLQAPDHSIRFANRYYRQQFGDIEGVPCYKSLWGRDESCEVCPTFKVFDTGQPQIWEWDQAPDGRCYEVYDYPFTDIDGTKLVLEMGTDITERKQAEEALRKNEERFRLLYERSPIGYQSLDADGNIIEVNPAWLSLLGYDEEEVIGRSFADFLASGFPELFKERFPCFKAAGEVSSVPFVMVTKDGSHIDVEINGKIGYNPDGSFKQTHCVLNDITDRKQAEETLRFSHDFLEKANLQTKKGLLLDGFVEDIQKFTKCQAVGIRLLDESGNIPYESYVGFPEEFYELESPLSIRGDKCMCINVITGNTDSKLPFYTKGGSFYMNGTTDFLATVSQEDKGQSRNECNKFGYESVALIPIRVGNSILGAIHIADSNKNKVPLELVEALEKTAIQMSSAIIRITAEEQLNKYALELENAVYIRTKELASANDQLQRQIEKRLKLEKLERKHRQELAHFARLSTIGEMASGLAHEINQPLCAISTNAKGAWRMMKAGTGSKNDILEAMAEVGNQAERAGQIINRIRKMVRKQYPQQSSIIIENIIDDAVLFFKSESQNLNITIEKVDPPDTIPGLFGDPIQIEQVLLNLLHNSIDALGDIDKSGKTIAIGISKVESDKVEILVSDNGKGISIENCDKMFDPFFTTKAQGIGVGLSISRSIIEAHGGKIWSESNPDRGLTVRFTLPLKGVHNE